MTNDFSDPRYWVTYELMRGGIEDRAQLESLTGLPLGGQHLRTLFVRLDNAHRHLIEYPKLAALITDVRCENCGATLDHIPCGDCGRKRSHYKSRATSVATPESTQPELAVA